MSSNHGNEQNKKPNVLLVICYLSSPRSGVVCDLLNPRPMWPRTLYFALLFLAFHGLSIADELNAFTPPTLDHPLKVKVVVVAMFEVGADTGDVPGEFQFWVERRKLDHVISLPAAYHDVRTDGNGLIGTVTGEGTAKAAGSVPRFLQSIGWAGSIDGGDTLQQHLLACQVTKPVAHDWVKYWTDGKGEYYTTAI